MKNLGRYFEVILPAIVMLVIFSLAQSAWAVTPQIRAGTNHTVMLHSDGTIWTTGSNSAGQLGDGSGSNLRKSPVQVGLPANAANWMMVTTGTDHTLALKADGSLWAWGSNQFGQIGDGTSVDKRSPVRIGTGNDWTTVAAGGSSSFALKADGTLWAWGNNAKGQLGDGTVTATSLVPVPVINPSSNGGKYVAVSAGAEHTLALQADGSLWAWGSNQYGNVSQMLDQGDQFTITHRQVDLVAHSTPVQVDADYDWKLIAAGGSHSMAIKADGTLWAWGNNAKGQMGIGVTDVTAHLAPVQVGTNQDWASLTAGDLYTLAVKRNGTLWAWGYNQNGQLGDGTNTDQNKPIRISILSDGTDITDIVAVAAGASHSLALKSNGEIYAWGANLAGQLGDGTLVGSLDPFQVATDAINWVSTEPGGQFTAARRSDGTLWTWGDNASGQLGDSSFTLRTAPAAMVGTATNWVAQATGWDHTVALKADGTLWAWGDNISGQLGDNSNNPSSAPKQITVANNWAAVAAGDYHTLALKADGTLWAWGDNASGQLGDGTTISKSAPVQIVDGIGGLWVAIAAGGSHSMALQSDGTLWAWGDNSYGQLGEPAVIGIGSNPAFISTPQQVVNFVPPTTGYNSSWVAIAAGLNHSLALQADGTLWAWGGNDSGQLGNANATDQNVPVKVLNPGTSRYVAISVGDSYSVARQADGSLWSWGNNTSGQLGNGLTDATPLANSTPTQETTKANDWFSAGSGGSHTIALKADGTLLSWGSIVTGQLPNGTITLAKINTPTPLTEARIDVSPETLAYNIVAMGTESLQTITIVNKGAATLNVNALTISGQDNSMFSVKAGGTCGNLPFTLAPAASCTVNVAFKAALPGGAKIAELIIASNDPNKSAETVELSAMAGVMHTLTTSLFTGSPVGSGTISPSGAVLVLDGSSQTITITPATGYHLADVTVDGASQGVVKSLTLPSVKADAKIVASFVINTYLVSMTANNGTIEGPPAVVHGNSAIFSIAPGTGYHIADVKVDGVSQGAIATLTVPAVTADIKITASFVLNSYPITVESDSKGTMSPSGNISVEHGSGLTVYFKPYPGYNVVNAIVDGVSQGSIPSYTFSGITSGGHTVKLVCIPDGDLNGDGKVDVSDALHALRISVGLVTPTATDLLHGDVAPLDTAGIPVPDTNVSIADALMILKKVVGLTSGW